MYINYFIKKNNFRTSSFLIIIVKYSHLRRKIKKLVEMYFGLSNQNVYRAKSKETLFNWGKNIRIIVFIVK